MNGWIKLHKKLRYSEVYKDKNAKLVLLHIFVCVDLEGKCVVSRYATSKELQMKPSTFRDALRRLRDFKITTLKTTRDTTTVYLNNWEEYQQPTRQPTRQPDFQNTTLIKELRIKKLNTNTVSKTKNTKPANEKQNDEYREWLDAYNAKFGTKFKSSGSSGNFDFWRETYSLQEMKDALLNLEHHQWLSDKHKPELVLRRTDTSKNPVDRIGELLSIKVKRSL